MKRLLLLTGFLLPSLGFSQSLSDQKQSNVLDRGHISVGINSGGAFGTTRVGVMQSVTARVQYFPLDGLSIGLEGRHNINGDFSRYTGFGLSSRYYFVRDRRLALFGQVGASIGQSKVSAEALEAIFNYLPATSYTYERSNAKQTTAGLGIHFRLTKRLSLEGLGERAWTDLNKTLSIHRWQGNVGINFLLK